MSKTTIWGSLAFVLMLVAAISVIVFHYIHILDKVAENHRLKVENIELSNKLGEIEAKITTVNQTLERVERFDNKLRTITQLNDPKRNLAIGPISGPSINRGDAPPLSPDQMMLRMDVHNYNLSALEEKAQKQEKSLAELDAYLDTQRSLLAHTPAIWPVRGWITSDFGNRLDPYTGTKIFHRGLDVATEPGTSIVAPADGEVIFAALNGTYGKFLAIDHGFGIITRYGHLMKMKVKVGDIVKRGQIIGLVGNTGRSTGPHLHYEVEVDGIPVNPRTYILD
ncbi:MAG: M23 family metallopeptidase [Myxococcota bacterium]